MGHVEADRELRVCARMKVGNSQMSKSASQEDPRRAGWVRLSVVLSDELADHVRETKEESPYAAPAADS